MPMLKLIKKNFNISWLCQSIASTSWIISVFVYGTFTSGDYFQLLAASAWTTGNIFNILKD